MSSTCRIGSGVEARGLRWTPRLGRLVREASACFYASTAWVREHGHPRRASDLSGRMLIGIDRSGRYLEHLHQVGIDVQEEAFAAYAENRVTFWHLVQAGCGIAPMWDEMAAVTTGVVRVLDEMPPIHFPIWLVTHRELRTARRTRVVFDFLAEALAAPAAPAGVGLLSSACRLNYVAGLMNGLTYRRPRCRCTPA